VIRRREFIAGLPFAVGALTAASAGAAAPADRSMQTLMDGNARYVRGELHCDVAMERRAALAAKQAPMVAILSCSDSRVPVEHIFDQPPGSIFVIRVAGNVATTETIASVEYAVHVLKTPLVLVLGHESCGAVKAALEYLKSGTALPGELQSLVTAIAPAIGKGQTLREATDANVRHSVARLQRSTLTAGAKIAGGYFEIASGRASPVS